jgi:mediator of RNA polymerase II transcription subunit 12
VAISSNAWYTQEFTNIFTSWMRLQLVQMALPPIHKGPVKAGVPPPKAPVGILGDEKARSRWLAKWDYTYVELQCVRAILKSSTSLLRELHAKYLISTRLLTTWLGEHLLTANLAQVGFIVQLVGNYISDMARHVVNGRICVRAACEKLKEVCKPSRTRLTSDPFIAFQRLAQEDRDIIVQSDQGEWMSRASAHEQSLVERQPELLLSPATWRSHSATIRDILHDIDLPLEDYDQRNTALLFVPSFSNDTSSPRRLQMQEIQKLDSMSSDTNMSELCKSFFDGSSSPLSATLDQDRFQEKVYILLAWAMSLFTLGVHRPYAICTLLKLWHDERTGHLAKTNHEIDIDVFSSLYNWLDTSGPARNPSNVLAIGITLGELTRSGLFSYGRYIRTLIAQGKTARCAPEHGRSHHLGILRALPIFVEGKDLMYQRRMALSGDDWETSERDEKEETRQMEAFQEEVREFVPEIFGYSELIFAAHN